MLDTKLLDGAQESDIETAEALLRSGKLVAVPTETVYGLAADASNVDAVQAIYQAKQRPNDHPLIVHIAAIDDMAKWAIEIPDEAYALAKQYWPGPLTLLLKKSPAMNHTVTGGKETIALRMPAHPQLLKLLKKNQLAVAAPSANLYGQLSPTTAQQVMATMSGKIDAVLDGGQCDIGLESTIVDVTSTPVRILRNGPITASDIKNNCQIDVLNPGTHSVSVPGNVEAHYQPHAELLLLDTETIVSRLAETDNSIAFVLYNSELAPDRELRCRHLPSDKASYARQLYKTLYELDTPEINTILVEAPPVDENWLDVNERLQKAASKR